MSRDTAILPRKLDWMVTDRAEDLKGVMSDNATFIQFPAIGSSTSLITVYGDHRVNIQRTIRFIMGLVCILPHSHAISDSDDHITRLAVIMLDLSGYFLSSSMLCCPLPRSIHRQWRLCLNKYPLQLGLKWSSRACALSSMAWRTKSALRLI